MSTTRIAKYGCHFWRADVVAAADFGSPRLPIVDPNQPPASWQLSPDGLRAARRLRLPAHAYLVASDEPKAIQTLAWAGSVATDASFNEIARDADESSPDWHDKRLQYVGGVQHGGWESHEAVVGRFERAVTSHLDVAESTGRHLVIATHGLVMTLWLHSRNLIPEPVSFWSELGFPELVNVIGGIPINQAPRH